MIYLLFPVSCGEAGHPFCLQRALPDTPFSLNSGDGSPQQTSLQSTAAAPAVAAGRSRCLSPTNWSHLSAAAGVNDVPSLDGSLIEHSP